MILELFYRKGWLPRVVIDVSAANISNFITHETDRYFSNYRRHAELWIIPEMFQRKQKIVLSIIVCKSWAPLISDMRGIGMYDL